MPQRDLAGSLLVCFPGLMGREEVVRTGGALSEVTPEVLLVDTELRGAPTMT